jgi:hypothetical protein
MGPFWQKEPDLQYHPFSSPLLSGKVFFSDVRCCQGWKGGWGSQFRYSQQTWSQGLWTKYFPEKIRAREKFSKKKQPALPE